MNFEDKSIFLVNGVGKLKRNKSKLISYCLIVRNRFMDKWFWCLGIEWKFKEIYLNVENEDIIKWGS